MKILEFYKKVLGSLKGYYFDSEGFAKVKKEKTDKPIMVEGLPLILPTRENISVLTKVENGKVVATKTVFNPLRDHMLNTVDSADVRMLKDLVEISLSKQFIVLVHLMLNLYRNKTAQKNVSMATKTDFLGKLTTGNQKTVMVDLDSVKMFDKLTEAMSTKSSHRLVKLFIKKGGKKEDGKLYSRSVIVTSKVYDQLVKTNETKNKTMFDIKFRNKEIVTLKLVYEFIFGTALTEPHIIEDVDSASFKAIMEMYINLATRMNKLIDEFKDADPELYPLGKVELLLTLEEINSSAKVFGAESRQLPSCDTKNAQVNKPASVAPTNNTTHKSFVPTGNPAIDRILAKSAGQKVDNTEVPTERFNAVNNNVYNNNNVMNNGWGNPQPQVVKANINQIMNSNAGNQTYPYGQGANKPQPQVVKANIGMFR